MKILPIIAMTLALTACATAPTPVVPTPVQIPALPASLAQRAEPLPPITGNDLHSLIRDGLQTDRLYGDLRLRHNATVAAYECVRRAINLQTDPSVCFADATKDQ